MVQLIHKRAQIIVFAPEVIDYDTYWGIPGEYEIQYFKEDWLLYELPELETEIEEWVINTPGVHNYTEEDGRVFITAPDFSLADMCRYFYNMGLTYGYNKDNSWENTRTS